MIQVTDAEFMQQCLKLIDEAVEQGKITIITKNGVPIAKLLPYEDKTINLFGFMQGKLTLKKEIISPIDGSWDIDTE